MPFKPTAVLKNSAHGSQEIAETGVLWSIHLNDCCLQYNHRRVKIVGTKRGIKTDAHCLAWHVAGEGGAKGCSAKISVLAGQRHAK